MSNWRPGGRSGAEWFLALWFWLGAHPAMAAPTVWQKWLSALTKAGYVVTQGSAVVDTAAYCTKVVEPVLGKCNGNDPNDPYVLPLVPFGAGYVDPYYGTLGEKTLRNGTVVGQVYHLATTEAELLIVNMPPAAAYFSYQNYIYSRVSSDYPGGAQQPTLDPARGELRATYNNSINNIDISAQSGIGFGGGTIAIITTPNANLVTDMTSRFMAVGGTSNQIFPAPVGTNLIPGLTSASDDFYSVFRYLVPQSSAAAKAWLASVTNNVQVYRIEQPASLTVATYPPQTLNSKLPYATDETGQAVYLAELSTLLQGWLANEEQKSTVQVQSFGVSEQISSTGVASGEVGPICVQFGDDCFGDEQDTAAYWNSMVGRLGADQAIVIDGVNHAVTGNSASISLSLINSTVQQGILGVSQSNPAATGFSSGAITGSAAAALQALGLWGMASPGLQADAPNLYVQIFTRGCTPTQTYCTQPFTTVIPSGQLPLDAPIALTARAYLLPGSNTGANPDYLLPPQVIY